MATPGTERSPARLHDAHMRVFVLLLTVLFANTCSHAPQPVAVEPRAVDGVAAFRTRLQAELKEAMARGPEHAITVCRDRAPRIAAESGAETLQLGRSSLRLRNPANAPAAWVEEVLESYASHPEDRSPRTVALPDGRSGYAEPIVVQPLCLVCHGETVAPAVQKKLAELYPHDRATGYRQGDFRGVFWAVTAGTSSRRP